MSDFELPRLLLFQKIKTIGGMAPRNMARREGDHHYAIILLIQLDRIFQRIRDPTPILSLGIH